MKLSISDLDTYSSMINSKILEIIEKINPQKSVGLFYPYKNEVDVLRISNDLIVLEELDVHLNYQRYWWLSILIFPLIMISSSFNLLSIVEGAVIGTIILLVLLII